MQVLTKPALVSKLRRGKLRIPAVTDGTVLYDAADFTVKRVAQIPGRKAIVLMTDGVDESSRISLKETLSEIGESDILIYTMQYNTLPQLPQHMIRIKQQR